MYSLRSPPSERSCPNDQALPSLAAAAARPNARFRRPLGPAYDGDVPVWVMLLAVATAGCDGSAPPMGPDAGDASPDAPTGPDGGGPDGGDSDGGDAGTDPEIVWAPCESGLGPSVLAECATVSLPLDWDTPTGPTIELFVRHTLAAETPTAQLWYFSGGPGQPADFGGLHQLRMLAPTLDAYVVDPRGTGASTRIGECPDLDYVSAWLDRTAVESCHDELRARWGDGLRHFSTTQDARDVIHLIQRSRVPGQSVVLVGLSYGTYRALRVLQLEPAIADGVVLDSIVPPTFSAIAATVSADEVVARVFDACAADALCSEKLGADPMAVARALPDRIAAGHCSEATLDADELKVLYGNFVLGDYGLYGVLPALVYRLDRCDPADVTAILFLLDVLGWDDPEGPVTNLDLVTHAHVVANELLDRPDLTASEIAALEASSASTTGLAEYYRGLADHWPVDPPDPLDGLYPATDVPMLFLVGDLDARTPVSMAMEVALHFPGAHRELAVIPWADHDTLKATGCARDLAASFISSPATPPSVSDCGPSRGLSFDGGAEEWFGTADLWEN